MGEDHDGRGAGRAGTLRDHGGERALAVDGLRAKVTGLHREAAAGRPTETLEELRNACRARLIALTAGAAVGEFGREPVGLAQRA